MNSSLRIRSENVDWSAGSQLEVESSHDQNEGRDADSYFSSLGKDDTIVKKPITLRLLKSPQVKPTARWGDLFQGKRVTLLINIKGLDIEPIPVEVEDRFVIGRAYSKSGEKPDLDLNKYGGHFGGVSRKHMAIVKDDNTLWVTDLGSTNGSYLNGSELVPYQPRLLRHADELCLGHLIFTVHFPPPEQTTSA